MDSLRIRLLAQLEVIGTNWRDLGSRKGRTALTALALARGETVATERLADVLWADRLPANPAEQVQVLVSRLRNVLGHDRIERVGIGYRLHYDWLDLDELEHLAEAAIERAATGATASARAAAAAALRLVTGRPLDGEDDHWADVERRRIERTVSTIRLIAAESALADGHIADAVRLAGDALGHDPFDEPALRTLMLAHVAAGRPAAALSAYASTREAMAEQLGTSPTEVTEQLHTDVLLGRIDVPDVIEPSGHTTLVGRDRELAWLDQQYASSTSGPARLVQLVGEPGIGKTALVEAWLTRVADDATVVSIRGDPIGRDLPLQPILDVLAPDEHVPSIADEVRTTRATAVGDPAAQRARLYLELLERLRSRAIGRTMIITVDDANDMDDSTMAWLRFAVRRSSRLLVIMAVRPPPPVGATPEATLEIGPLDRAAAEQLVGAASVEASFGRSGGNPLYLIELSRPGAGAVPSAILDAARQRAEQLGAAATTLRSAAVLGTDVDIDLLAACTSRPVAQVLDDLEAAVAVHLLIEHRTGFAFAHELIREALAQTVTAARRAFIHREATRALQQRAWSPPLRTAHHARQGGATETAAQALMEGSVIAISRFELEVAERLLDESLRLVDRPDTHIARARVRMARSDHVGAADDVAGLVGPGADASVFELAGWIAYYRRDFATARRCADEALRLAGGGEVQRSAHALAGRIDHSRGDLAVARGHLEQAVTPQDGVTVGAVWRGALEVHLGRFDEAIATLHDLDDGAVSHPFASAHAAVWRTMAHGLAGHVPPAFAALDALDRVVDEQGAQGERFRSIALNLRGWLLRSVGHDQQADSCNLSALGSTTDSSFDEPFAHARLDLAEGCIRRNDLPAAARWVDETERRVQESSTMAWHIRQRVMWLRGRIALSSGAADDAAALARALIDDADRRGSRRYAVLGRHLAEMAHGARPPDRSPPATLEVLLDDIREQAALEAWWLIVDLADVTGDQALRVVARAEADHLLDSVAGCPALDLAVTKGWIDARFAASTHRA